MAAIVTGGAGFLGSHLVDALVAHGESVLVVDNLSSGRLSNLEGAISSGQVTLLFGDVTDGYASWDSAISLPRGETITTVYHLATPGSPKTAQASPWDMMRANGLGTMTCIEYALAKRAMLVFVSVPELGGAPLVHARSAPPSDGAGVAQLLLSHCEGKRFGEAAIAVAAQSRGLAARIVRLYNCYGPRLNGSDGRLIPALLEAAWEGKPFPIYGDGQQRRSLMYVDDAVRLLLLVAQTTAFGAAPLHAASDEELTVAEAALLVARIAGVHPEIDFRPARIAEPTQPQADLTAVRALGWHAATSLVDGLTSTLAWLRDERAAFV
jgi:nucleoside-diphosphate-sugar epimerase